jgi:hypothetical protein
VASSNMANILKDGKKQQIIALGRLGWSLRRPGCHTGTPRNHQRLSESCRRPDIAAEKMEAWEPGKTGHTGDDRLW